MKIRPPHSCQSAMGQNVDSISNVEQEHRRHVVLDILNSLEQWLIVQGFKGYDPHDGLNSAFLKRLTLGNKYLGIAVVHLMRDCPINLRPYLGVPKEYNSKAIALFLRAYICKYHLLGANEDLERAQWFADWLISNAIHGYSGLCWGYNFDWPNRGPTLPKGTPTVIVTSFAGQALLDLYVTTQDSRYLEAANSACQFVVHDLQRTRVRQGYCLSYSPLDATCAHNANMLGAALLARVGHYSQSQALHEVAQESMLYALNAQRQDGSWPYGEGSGLSWVDSFHSGYNLVALNDFLRYSARDDCLQSLRLGYKFYCENFFLPNGVVKYYHMRTYPLDVHAFAHAVICLSSLSFLEPAKSSQLVSKVLDRMIYLFWSGKGYFYYRRTALAVNRIPYIRWSQAWVFFSLWYWLATPDENYLIPLHEQKLIATARRDV